MGRSDDVARMSLRWTIWLLVGSIVAIFAVSTAFSLGARLSVARTLTDLNDQVMPARTEVAALTKALVDQETGQRGFLLTGDPSFLQPYDAGRATATPLLASLRSRLSNDDEAARRLEAVAASAERWTTEAAEPEIAARRSGQLPPPAMVPTAQSGKQLFDALRTDLAALDTRMGEIVAEHVHDVGTAQRVANVAQYTAIALVLGAIAAAAVLIRRSLTRPVDAVVRDVRAVADGNYDHHIFPRGPREIAVLAEAVEVLRGNLRSSAKRLVDAERRAEQSRMAAKLHDRTIRRVFGLGLDLTSASAREASDMRPLIAATDDIIEDLQRIIFDLDDAHASSRGDGLRSAIIEVVDESAPHLGFAPSLTFVGPVERVRLDPGVDVAVLTVLREAIGAVALRRATSATVRVAATDEGLALRVTDGGVGADHEVGREADPDVLAKFERIRSLTTRHGGRLLPPTDSAPGRVLDWEVPATTAESA